MIAIIDYGMGNLRSVQKAFERLGVDATVTSDAAIVRAAEKVVLPGVGAIADAVRELERTGLAETIRETVDSGKPFLGICLGFQALFESSEENAENSDGGESVSTPCLGIFPGKVVRFPAFPDLVVPHMGWNRLRFKESENPLYRDLSSNDYVYFVHSYYVAPSDPTLVATTTEYGFEFCSSIARGNVFGVQFHPEKSQGVGLKILRNFADL